MEAQGKKAPDRKSERLRRLAATSPARAGVGKNTKTAVAETSDAKIQNTLKKVVSFDMILLDEYKSKLAEAGKMIKEAGDSL